MKRKQMFPAFITLVVLIICAVLPAFFMPGNEVYPTPAPDFDVDYRANMYSRGVAGELERTELDSSAVDAGKQQACREVMDTVISGLVADTSYAETLVSTGTNLFSLTDEYGHSINVMEYYREWAGDWKNWFIIQMDLDTGEIYHVYTSSSCERNHENYYGAIVNAYRNAIWQAWGAYIGMDLKSLDIIDEKQYELVYSRSKDQKENRLVYTDEDEQVETWNAVNNMVTSATSDSDQLRYNLLLSLYEDSAPSIVVDIEFTLRGS